MATRYAYALVPLGFGMWLAHYSFHFLTSYDTVVPVAQRFAADLGLTWLGKPAWGCACCRPGTGWLLRLEILFLDVGLLLSLYTGYRLASIAEGAWRPGHCSWCCCSRRGYGSSSSRCRCAALFEGSGMN